MDRGAQFKFDPKNTEHVDALMREDVEIHPGGYISYRTPSKKSKSSRETKAVAKDSNKDKPKTTTSETKKKKAPSWLESARNAEDDARKRGDLPNL